MSKPENLFPFKHLGEAHEGLFAFHQYNENKRIAVELLVWDDSYLDRWSKISVNENTVNLEDDEFIAKEYSENEGLVQQFIDAGYFEDTGKKCVLGHVSDVRILKVLPVEITEQIL